MRVLLDTQVWLWMLAAPERLSKKSRAFVVSVENELILSAASAYKFAARGRETFPGSCSTMTWKPSRRSGTGFEAAWH